MMQMDLSYSLLPSSDPIESITIGFFDGCHLGHQALLSSLKQFPGKSGVITFSEHPKHTLSNSPPETITSLEERIQLLTNCHIDYLAILPFNQEIANEEAEMFILSLYESLHPSRIIFGYDSRLGRGGLGNAQTLKPFASSLGISLEEIPPLSINGTIVSSRKIRQFLREGDLLSAEKFLGRPFSYTGTVTRGQGIGSSLGYATINLNLTRSLLPLGVYSCSIKIGRESYLGVMNLGMAPTVQRNQLCLEAHILDLSADLYEQRVTVIPKQFLREEKTFSSQKELALAIQEDIRKARLS
ncbi:bifunctional riboflavin kinase/FAD synthetase [Chlamydia muridarum str. Nigg]|nr:bifunctional riboflavin kinase/FAD synthetase [Chlamydia muridarum]UFT86383.1 bifunctional riboflavin kinase/FAD synthetase [Chlamydia trachomatis]AVM88135.1 bifunctional riboflavin kinase/FAD synthetase [Chlamydia muridarum str. Nigg]AVM89561.1 bifunctional riboflavin kinase/FAD synthetase [Chlamydia muridarum str. Nigg]AVM89923.1 bifunctional riboflavin kinase/FAD synthetase [Chlamydia muridarum str. Nigg]AVM90818.1 bifunctional riboflavin kinase/FAD synthetase [Chlamydia muridarum str. N